MENAIVNMKFDYIDKLIGTPAVICLTNLPNVLFCNCGHIPICGECKEIKPLDICLICKTHNFIKRII